jgi:hypothetical protein
MEAVLETVVEGALDEGLVPGAESAFEAGGSANASSARASVTRLFSGAPADGDCDCPNSNF